MCKTKQSDTKFFPLYVYMLFYLPLDVLITEETVSRVRLSSGAGADCYRLLLFKEELYKIFDLNYTASE